MRRGNGMESNRVVALSYSILGFTDHTSHSPWDSAHNNHIEDSRFALRAGRSSHRPTRNSAEDWTSRAVRARSDPHRSRPAHMKIWNRLRMTNTHPKKRTTVNF